VSRKSDQTERSRRLREALGAAGPPKPKLIWVCRRCGSRDLEMTVWTELTGRVDQNGTETPDIDRAAPTHCEMDGPKIRCRSCGVTGRESAFDGRPPISWVAQIVEKRSTTNRAVQPDTDLTPVGRRAEKTSAVQTARKSKNERTRNESRSNDNE
jgi:hypothetical protein